MKISRKEWTIYLLTTALTIGVVYAISVDNFDLRVLRGVSRACQGTARVVGQWGMRAEHTYLQIMNNQRLV
jgi:hypothetical protein